MTTRHHLRQAVLQLQQGQVIGYATEAVYGLGCDPYNSAALQRLLAIKHRSAHKGLILLAAHLSQIEAFILPLSLELKQQLMQTWPGFVTWLLPARSNLSPLLQGRHQKIAVRITDHPQAAELCQHFGGAIVSTSANLGGHPASADPMRVRRQLGRQIAYMLPSQTSGENQVSQIWDSVSGLRLR